MTTMLSSIIRYLSYRTASTAQHSTARSTRTSSKQVCADQTATTQAKQTELARARMSSSIFTAGCVLKPKKSKSALKPAFRRAFVQLVRVFSKRTKKSKLYKRSQSILAGVMCEEFACTFSPSFLFRPCMLRPIFVDHGALGIYLQVASLYLKPWTYLSASSIPILFSASLCYDMVDGPANPKQQNPTSK